MASTSKIMTAHLVLRLAAKDPKVLDEVIAFSERADKTIGSSANINAGEKVAVRELLYGLMLPSGNDAATALAEHFGCRFGKDGDAYERFIGEMNRRAKELGLKELSYRDPHGLSRDNVSSARDLAVLAHAAMKDERFRRVRCDAAARVRGDDSRRRQADRDLDQHQQAARRGGLRRCQDRHHDAGGQLPGGLRLAGRGPAHRGRARLNRDGWSLRRCPQSLPLGVARTRAQGGAARAAGSKREDWRGG